MTLMLLFGILSGGWALIGYATGYSEAKRKMACASVLRRIEGITDAHWHAEDEWNDSTKGTCYCPDDASCTCDL